MEQQRLHQEDRVRRALERAQAEPKKKVCDEVACVAWRFWLGALSNKGGRGQTNREEIGAEAT